MTSTYQAGTEVERVPCPLNCIEPDCRQIPLGTIGIIDRDRSEASSYTTAEGGSHHSRVWRVRWTPFNGETFGWWTHEHAFAEAAAGFPDELWLT